MKKNRQGQSSVSLILILFAVLMSLFWFVTEGKSDVYRKRFKIIKQPTVDLLKEAATVKLQTEEGVQTLNPAPRLFVSLLAGLAAPSHLTMVSSDHAVGYAFSQPLGLITAEFVGYLNADPSTRWGLLGSIGYSYSEYVGLEKTSLHFVPVQLAAAYRPERLLGTNKVAPLFFAGPALWTFFQRGIEQYNTSSSFLLGTVGAGLSLNLNRFKLINSRNEGEIILQYRRSISASNADNNFNGNMFELGGTIAL